MSKARIRDVAEKANVSPRTVTRVLRGGNRVAEKTRTRIQKALKELDYSPNIIARALKTQKTYLIGIIMQDIHIEIFSKKLTAFELEAARRGYRVMLGFTESDFKREISYIRDYINICDGILLFVDWAEGLNRQSIDLLEQHDKPYVIVEGDSKEKYSVSIDRQSGVLEAIEQSHKMYSHFTYFGSKIGAEKNDRIIAFKKAVKRIDKHIKPKLILREFEKYEDGYSIGDEIVEQKNCLVCCSNDHLAMGLLKRLLEVGVNVPEEIGLFGFDDDSYTSFTYKALSTISHPIEKLVKYSFDMLIARFDGEIVKRIKPLSTRFIKRDTT